MGVFHELRRRWDAVGCWEAVALAGAEVEGEGIVDLAGPAAHADPYRQAIGGDADHPVASSAPSSLRYADLYRRALAAAGLLRAHGIGAGDIIAVQTPRSLAFLELYLGALALGAAVLPLNDRYPPAEVDFYRADAAPRLCIILDPRPGDLAAADLRAALDGARPLSLAELPEPPDHALATLLYTSGTTGRPKGAMISHGNILATVHALHQAWRWSTEDHILHALPLFHVHGLFAAQLGALWAGARATWVPRFEAEAVLSLLERRRCTVFMGVPTFYHRFLDLPARVAPDLSGMRLFTCGSAPLPAADLRAFRDRFGHTILERYGMTEVGLVLSNPYEGERRPGAVGFPVPGAGARITDVRTGRPLPAGEVGEIRIQGPSVISGYLNRPDQSAQALGDGWMHTGDLGLVDQDGYFHVVGRLKELVITGGLNVYPREVERVLRAFPGVAEVAVLGLPDPDLGERVVAAVVARQGEELDLDGLKAHARAELAPYKCPKELVVVAELPRNAMGKVQKHRLRDAWPGG